MRTHDCNVYLGMARRRSSQRSSSCALWMTPPKTWANLNCALTKSFISFQLIFPRKGTCFFANEKKSKLEFLLRPSASASTTTTTTTLSGRSFPKATLRPARVPTKLFEIYFCCFFSSHARDRSISVTGRLNYFWQHLAFSNN